MSKSGKSLPRDWIPSLFCGPRNFDQLRCKDMEEISKVIEENFGRPLDAIFSQFDENPLGSASIGQVHKAVLRESNQTVAVKVLHRDAKGFFRADLATLEKFTKIAQKQLLPFVKQWRKLFEEEFDCRKEAQKMEEIGRNLEHWKRYVKVPRVFSDYCTEEVLVMEYLEGNKLSDSLSDIVRELRRMKDERSELSSYVKTRNRFAAVSSAAAVEKIESAVLTVIELLVKAINRMSFGFFKRNFLEEPHLVRINRLRKLVKTLVEVHGRTLFIDGIYNPDPHGGNVLILEDGKLGLIDYGQAARVDLDFRRKLASLLVAIDRGDWDNVEKYNAEIGFRTEKRSPKILRESARLFFGDGKTGKVAFPQYLESLFKGDPLLDYPADLFMAGKLAIILRGISLCLWGEVSMAHSWRPAAEEFLRKNQN
ncbi:hypothetical protein MHBO_000550 [Bonamia ostreae]|uniref:Protein kinase domain-containing protein n=1 Tax=Bonamia ostreae TaxID=126728 RepID=A0ABV2AFY6_9EUKA